MNHIPTEANAGQRAGATAIDYILIFTFTFWYVLTFGEPNDSGGKTVQGLPALIPMIFWFLWLIVAESVFGTTLGHKLSGLKVVSMDGSKPTFGQVFKRRLCDAVEISWCFGF